MHATREQARTIVGKGGEYVLQIKGNQPQLSALVQRARTVPPPFFELTDPSRGRVTTWRVSVVVATPSQADYHGLRSLVLVDKTTVRKRDLTESCEQRAYASSLAPAERSPAQMLALIRGHWGGVEISNHWRRDACWREDHSRTRNVNAPWPTSPSCAASCCASAPNTGPSGPCRTSSNAANIPRISPCAPSVPIPKTKDHGLARPTFPSTLVFMPLDPCYGDIRQE
ncbi:MAG: ISAs1 family transposase [Candidatus Synoicihabitans palmerolidicus]|nr:ISAs1 family transposase [Candidatus Synoicihabitans palmerolidicus]